MYGAGVRAGMYPLSRTELYWYTIWDEDPETPAPPTPVAMKEDAAARVSGWSWGICEAVAATPLEGITRSRIADRCGAMAGTSNTWRQWAARSGG
jgi:hypothetical protein